MSRKHGLNAKIFTEADIVRVDETSSKILYNAFFMKSQGYEIKDNVVLHDNRCKTYWKKMENNLLANPYMNIIIPYLEK